MARRLEDSFVVPKRLEAHHQEDLFEVVRDPKVWRWPPYDASESQGRSGPGQGRLFRRRRPERNAPSQLLAPEPGLDRRHPLPHAPARAQSVGDRLNVACPPHMGNGREGRGQALNTGARLRDSELHERRVPDQRVLSRRARGVPRAVRGDLTQAQGCAERRGRDMAYRSIVDDEWSRVKQNLRRRVGG